MSQLDGKVAIVTGASRGIGAAIAKRLAEGGARVHAVARDRGRLEALATSTAGLAIHVCDVGDEAAVERTVREVADREGGVDILVNNAGIGEFASLEETSYESFWRVMRVNVGGTFLFSRAVLAPMRARGGGDIINVSSVVGQKGYDRQAVYGASKHAVMGLTKALAVEVQADGIRVRSICPGGVDTELITRARPDLDRTVLMRPEDIAELAWFLLTGPAGAVVDNLNVRRPGSSPWF